jgi:hypothetical protein
MLLALPAIACNPLSRADEETAENASALASNLVDAVKEQTQEIEGVETLSEDSVSDSEEASGSSSSGSGSSESANEIAEAFRSSLTVDAMRIIIINKDGRTDTTTSMSLAFVRPGRYEMISDDAEIVVVDGTSYYRTSTSEWSESPADMVSTVEQTLQAFVSEEAIEARMQDPSNDWDNLKSLGTDTINGNEVRGYEYESEIPGTDIYSIIRMWVGTDDNLLYRQEIEGNLDGFESITIMEFEYGDDVTIEPPI